MRISQQRFALPNAKVKIDERWVALRESAYYKYGVLSYAILVGPDIYGSPNQELIALSNATNQPVIMEIHPYYIAPTAILREWVRVIYGADKVNEMRRVAERRRDERIVEARKLSIQQDYGE